MRTLAGRLLRRLLDRPVTVRRAVLLLSDQRRNALPSVCVKSGEQTDAALRVRAVESRRAELYTILIGQAATVAILGLLLRRRVEVVSLPVSEHSWRLWRSRLTVSVLLSAVGAALALVGLLRGITGMLVLGLVILGAGWLNRVSRLEQRVGRSRAACRPRRGDRQPRPLHVRRRSKGDVLACDGEPVEAPRAVTATDV